MSSISKMIDAGSVLVESACSIDRVDEGLRTLLPLIPGTKYFRFNPIDERCQVELDDTEASLLQGLLDATEEYVKAEDKMFTEVCNILKAGGY